MHDGEPTARRALRHRLALRLGLWLALGAAVILLAAGWWNVNWQRRHMTGLVRDSADRIADTIRRSTRDAMLRNEPEQIERILAGIGSQQGIERIRIVDKKGYIWISTVAHEVRTNLDPTAEECHVCHRADRPLEHLAGPDRVRILDPEDGDRLLCMIAPIRNEPDCGGRNGCHAESPAERPLLGVLSVYMSLAPVDAQLAASERQMLGGLLLTVLAVLALFGYFTWRTVLRPVRRLTEATRRVAVGDLSERLEVTASDEIGELTTAWNTMVADLQRSRWEREEWNRTLEQRVREKTQKLEEAHRNVLLVEKMASLGKLAAVVAHELNNPLAGIQTYAKLLAKQHARRTAAGVPEQDGETAKVLRMIETEAARCGQIVKNLLLFSRTPAGDPKETDLPPLVERCVMLVRHQADLKEVEITQEVAADLPRIVCLASQVEQMLLALLVNALDALSPGGQLRIRLRPRLLRDGVVLQVEDTGSGISPEHLPHVFEPFFSTKDQGHGVGLGLAVTYGIVERHGGDISVASEPGRGTTFTVRLPLRPPAQDDTRDRRFEDAKT